MSKKSGMELSEIRGLAEGLIKELGVLGAAKKLGVNRSTMWRWKKGKTSPLKSNFDALHDYFIEKSVMFFRAKYIIQEEKTENGILYRRLVDRGYLSVTYRFVSERKYAREDLRDEINRFRKKVELSGYILTITKIEEIYKHIDKCKGVILNKPLTDAEIEQQELTKWRNMSQAAKKRQKSRRRKKKS